MFGALLGRKFESRGATFSLANVRDPALVRLFGGGYTSGSGVEVNENTALSAGAVKQAVRLLSQTMGMLPLHVYERKGAREKQKQRAPLHPLYRVLHSQPNPEQTRMEFMSMMVGNHVLRGNAYAEIVRDNGGRVRELWPIPATAVWMERDKETRERKYLVNVGGSTKPLRADQMLHIPNFTLDGVKGRGLLDDAVDAVGTMVAAERSGANLYANGLQIGGVLSHPKELGEDGQKLLRKSIDDSVGGIGKAGRYLLLEEGMTYEPMGISPKDAELINSRKFGILEVARHTNLPPHMLMDLDRATFSNIEEQGIQFVTYSLGPFIALFEQRFNVQLFSAREFDTFFTEFNVDGLLRGNIQARYTAYQTAINTGFMSRNEVRDFEGLSPFEGGDQMLEPLNMVPAGVRQNGPNQPAAQLPASAPAQDGEQQTRGRVESRGRDAQTTLRERQRLQKSFAKVISNADAKLVRREAREIKKLADKYLPATRGRAEQRSANDFLDKAEEYYGGDYKEQIKELLGPAIEAYAEAVAGAIAEERGGDVPPFANWLQAYIDNMADARAKTKYGKLIDLIKSSDGADLRANLDAAVDAYVEEEPDEVGQRESVQMGESLARIVYGAFGVAKFLWQANGNACPICVEKDGSPAEGNPPLHKGCSCSIVPEG